MKIFITLPTKLLNKKSLNILLFLLTFFTISYILLIVFYPSSPSKLLLIDQNKNIYNQNCPQINMLNLKEGEKHLLSNRFTLLNWNVFKQQKKHWESEFNHLLLFADIITLQEAKYSTDLLNIAKNNNFSFIQNYAFKTNGLNSKGEIYGVNTLSKISPNAICGTRDIEPLIRIPKTAIATWYKFKNNKTLLLINIHAINFTLTNSALKKQIKSYITLIQEHKGPVLFTGDFNTWSKDRLELIEATLFENSLKEVRYQNDHRIKVFGHSLDHIFYKNLTVIKAQSLQVMGSDHSPQLVTFENK